MTELTAEGTGESVGEAKWNALRELERQAPALDKGAVRFQVLTEGKRGLLGIGYAPARVVASVAESEVPPPPVRAADESPLAARARAVVGRVTAAMGLSCAVKVVEDDERISVTCTGGDLGLLIGRRGQTIDAVQAILHAIAAGSEEQKEVVVDAAGYRERRRRTLEAKAVRCAEQALRESRPIELDPMSAAERKLVHERLQDYEGVETVSEGDEPNRYVVVKPA